MKSTGVLSSLLIVGVVFATLLTVGEAYETGAPMAACELARPIHKVTDSDPAVPIDPQAAVSPYSFTVEVSEYRPGADLEVTIVGANDATFQGFLLQARTTGTLGVTVGTFTAPAADIGKLLECTTAGDTVTHSSAAAKASGQTFTWHAPVAGTGDVQFIGTVAENHDVFYSGILSDTLTEFEPTTKMTTSNAFKLSSGFGILLLATVISVLQIFV